MKKLTAEDARTDYENLKRFHSDPRVGLSLREERYMQALEIALPILEQQESDLCYVDPECVSDQDKKLSIVSGHCAGKAYNELCRMIGGEYPDCKIMKETPYAHKFFMKLFGATND